MKAQTFIAFIFVFFSLANAQLKNNTLSIQQNPLWNQTRRQVEEISAKQIRHQPLYRDFSEFELRNANIPQLPKVNRKNSERTVWQFNVTGQTAAKQQAKSPSEKPAHSIEKAGRQMQSEGFMGKSGDSEKVLSRHQTFPELAEKISRLSNQTEYKQNLRKSGGVVEKLDSAWMRYEDDEYPSKTYFEYDANHNCIKESRYYFSGTGEMGKVLASDYKDERSYDSNGNLISQVVYELVFDEVNKENYWKGVSKREQNWDNQNRVIESTYFVWDSDYRDWVYTTKYEYAYDDYGNEVLWANYSWLDYQWVGSYKDIYSYDSNGNKLFYIYYIWSNEYNDWIGSYKDEYQYDASGNLLQWSEFDWNGSEWYWHRKSTYTYNPEGDRTTLSRYDSNQGNWDLVIKGDYYYVTPGLMDSIVEQRYDPISLQWNLSNKREWIYGSNQIDNIYTYYNWSSASKKWLGSVRNEYRYDQKDRQIYYSYFSSYDQAESMWIGSNKWQKQYDQYDNQVFYEYNIWDSGTKEWKGSSTKWLSSYNADGNRLSYESYFWNSTRKAWDGNNKEEVEYTTQDYNSLWTEYSWDTESNTWVHYRKSIYTHNPDGSYATVKRSFWDQGISLWVEKIQGNYDYDGLDMWRTDMSRENGSDPYINSEKRMWKYNDADLLLELYYYLWEPVQASWKLDEKYLYTYNSNGKQLTYKTYSITDAEVFAYSLSEENSNTYNDAGILTIREENYIDDELDKYEWDYDLEGRLISLKYSELEGGTWDLEKYTINYVDGKMINLMYYWWDAGEWKNDYKTEIEYRPNGDLLRYVSYSWNGGWINSEKTERTYNGSNLCASETWSEWSAQENVWVNPSKSEFTYNEDNQLARVTEYYWVDGILQQEYRTNITYNSSGQAEVFTEQNYQDGLWENGSKSIYYYDANGNMVMQKESIWNGSAWSELFTVYERSIDLSMPRVDLRIPLVWFQENFEDDIEYDDIVVEDRDRNPEYELGYQIWLTKNKLVKEISHDLESSNGEYNTVHYKTSDLFYSRLYPTGIEEEETQVGGLYPNPVTTTLHLNIPEGISNAEITITDIAGKSALVTRFGKVSNEISIPVSHLEPGVYIVSIKAEGLNMVERVVKR